MAYSDLNPGQRNRVENYKEYIFDFGSVRVEKIEEDRSSEAYRKKVLKVIDDECKYWRGWCNERVSEQDREDINYRTSMLFTAVSFADYCGADIRKDEKSLIEAIRYCPEGIKEWYYTALTHFKFKEYSEQMTKEVVLSTEVVERIANESPDIIDRLPSDVISRESILKIVKQNPERWLNCSSVQDRVMADSSLKEELGTEIKVVELSRKVECLQKELTEKEAIIESQAREIEGLGLEGKIEEKTEELPEK